MVLFVVLVQWTGVFFVFLVFPIYLIPFLEERFEARLPRRPPDVREHVIVYRYGPAVESAVELLAERGVPALVAQKGQLKSNLLGMSFLNRLESWEVRGDRLRMRGTP
jgi:hypothetical protein